MIHPLRKCHFRYQSFAKGCWQSSSDKIGKHFVWISYLGVEWRTFLAAVIALNVLYFVIINCMPYLKHRL